ncbi:MAG: 3-methyl-2-oxobutanoate dehydrogenase subunit VorB [Planctomycetota bacterium]|nr:MAG: 3-methyl-2-oxobutanoate dehydrogenase subunit VorB [Planctomycetota bacterium]
MGEKQLLAGNEALGEAAIIAGCRHYFGYPITPQNEITAYMARRLPEVDGVFIQSESEIAAINMVLGAGATGHTAMTSSSSPGISLKQEGISYITGDEVPAVVVNVSRGGPGLGNIAPSQSDYFQATKGGGHGDYNIFVLAPHTVQEMADLTITAFDLAEKWRMVSMILADGVLGQMMEPCTFPDSVPERNYPKDWILDGKKGREKRLICSLYLVEGVLEKHNEKLQKKFKKAEKEEIRFEEKDVEGSDILLVGYGTSFRGQIEAKRQLGEFGVKAGLFRPITLWPFPYDRLSEIAEKTKMPALVVEMNAGQMLEDVRMAYERFAPVHFYGRLGGGIPTPEAVTAEVKKILGKG